MRLRGLRIRTGYGTGVGNSFSFPESNLGPSALGRALLTAVTACTREYSVGNDTKLVFRAAPVDIRIHNLVSELIH